MANLGAYALSGPAGGAFNNLNGNLGGPTAIAIANSGSSSGSSSGGTVVAQQVVEAPPPSPQEETDPQLGQEMNSRSLNI
jgi:hypothetical protein